MKDMKFNLNKNTQKLYSITLLNYKEKCFCKIFLIYYYRGKYSLGINSFKQLIVNILYL